MKKQLRQEPMKGGSVVLHFCSLAVNQTLYMKEHLDFGESGGIIISVKEARKILGVESKELSDEYLARVIGRLHNLSEQLLERTLVPKK